MAKIIFSAEDLDNRIEFAVSSLDPAESLVKRARIFYTGTHKGRKYSVDDLKKIQDNFKTEDDIDVRLDHSGSARDIIGKVRKIEVVGNELFGDLEFLGKENVDNIRLGKWGKLSCGLEFDDQTYKLGEVSVVTKPALPAAKVLHSDEPVNENPDVNMAEYVKMEEFAVLKARNEEMAKKILFTEDEKVIDRFCREGRTTPSMREKELAHFHSLTVSQKQAFLEYKATQPILVDTKVYNRQSYSPPGEMSREEADAEADKLLKYSGIIKETK